MTIELYSGTPGSGKSYHATRTVRDALKWKKQPVICNYPLASLPEGCEFVYRPNSELSPDWLVEYASDWWADDTHEFGEDSILLVIDECQLLFNSREWQDRRRMEWLEFFSQHRHYGYKVVFIAQFDKMVDRQIRSLIEFEYVHRKVANLGRAAAVLSFLFRGLFIAVKRYYPLNQRLSSEFFRCSKKVTSMYDSYKTVFAAGEKRTVRGDGRGESPRPVPRAVRVSPTGCAVS